jgi:hypothetical protein
MEKNWTVETSPGPLRNDDSWNQALNREATKIRGNRVT